MVNVWAKKWFLSLLGYYTSPDQSFPRKSFLSRQPKHTPPPYQSDFPKCKYLSALTHFKRLQCPVVWVKVPPVFGLKSSLFVFHSTNQPMFIASFYLFKLEDKYNIVMVFVIHPYELAIVIYVFCPSWTPFPHPSPPYPSRLSQSTGFGCPASYIKLPLAICFTYGHAYVSVLVSQVIPPPPSPIESKSLFFMSVSFAALHIGSLVPCF